MKSGLQYNKFYYFWKGNKFIIKPHLDKKKIGSKISKTTIQCAKVGTGPNFFM